MYLRLDHNTDPPTLYEGSVITISQLYSLLHKPSRTRLSWPLNMSIMTRGTCSSGSIFFFHLLEVGEHDFLEESFKRLIYSINFFCFTQYLVFLKKIGRKWLNSSKNCSRSKVTKFFEVNILTDIWSLNKKDKLFDDHVPSEGLIFMELVIWNWTRNWIYGTGFKTHCSEVWSFLSRVKFLFGWIQTTQSRRACFHIAPKNM